MEYYETAEQRTTRSKNMLFDSPGRVALVRSACKDRSPGMQTVDVRASSARTTPQPRNLGRNAEVPENSLKDELVANKGICCAGLQEQSSVSFKAIEGDQTSFYSAHLRRTCRRSLEVTKGNFSLRSTCTYINLEIEHCRCPNPSFKC